MINSKEHLNPSALIFPRLDIEEFQNDLKYKNQILNLVNKGVGGFCLFKGSIENTLEVITVLNLKSENKLIYMADFEFGTAMRVEDGISYPHNMALGNYNDTSQTKLVAKQIALEMKALGVHWNLAPVVDINSNKKNPIINIRSFGENEDIVWSHSKAFIEGLNEVGVINCIKHFPGHGDTELDSHSFLPTLTKSKNELFDLELKPFIKHIELNQLDSIMIGHLHIASMDSEIIPASISKNVVTIFLREELEYKGIIMTDALDMNPISKVYSTYQAINLAFEAGIDLYLMPENPIEAIEELNNLYTTNKNKTQIENSIKKLDYLKNKYNTTQFLPNKNQYESLIPNSEKLGLQIALKTIDLEIKDKSIIPMNINKRVACFSFVQTEKDIDKATSFYNFLSNSIENDIDFAFIDSTISINDINALKEGLTETNIFIFCFFYKSRSYQNSIGDSNELKNVIEIFNDKKSQQINIFFGNPYLAENLNSDVNIKTYSDSLPSLVAVSLLLSGKYVELNYLKLN